MADGNRHFEHKYFTVRERVALGEIALYWLSGKLNPADVTTKALDNRSIRIHGTVLSSVALIARRRRDVRDMQPAWSRSAAALLLVGGWP